MRWKGGRGAQFIARGAQFIARAEFAYSSEDQLWKLFQHVQQELRSNGKQLVPNDETKYMKYFNSCVMTRRIAVVKRKLNNIIRHCNS